MTPDIRVILMTAPDPEVALDLGRRLVEERLAACANVVPGLTSVFRWEGEVQEEAEALLILKTTEAEAKALVARAVDIHPYDVPEVIVLPVVDGHGPYLEWVDAETGDDLGRR